jgi:hypothetical protein
MPFYNYVFISQIVHEKLVKLSDVESSSEGTFRIDSSVGQNTMFGIYVADEEDHLIKSVSFTDSRGIHYGPYTSMSSLYDIINLKVINYPLRAGPPFDEVSNCSFM